MSTLLALGGIVALSAGLIVAILVLVGLNIFAIVFGLGFIRANREARQRADGQIELPSKPVKSVSRRDFFRSSLIVSLLVFGAQFGGATLAFLWPNLDGAVPAPTVPALVYSGGGVRPPSAEALINRAVWPAICLQNLYDFG